MQTIQGELAPIWLSDDGGDTFKLLVCLETYSVGLDTTVNQTETNCGIATGLGAIKFTPKGSAVLEAAPEDDEVTYQDMINWQMNKTLLRFKTEYPGSGSQYGKNLALSGDCFVTSTSGTMQVGEVIKFDFTLTGNGTVSNQPV